MKTLTIIFKISTILIILITGQILYSQPNTIIMGLETDSIYIYDIEDIHIIADISWDEVRFDFDSNGLDDIVFIIMNEHYSTRTISKISIGGLDNTQVVFTEKPLLTGPCDSIYSPYNSRVVKNLALNSILTINDTYEDGSLIAIFDMFYNPCIVNSDMPYWVAKEGYIGIKKLLSNGIIGLGWFKIEVIDYNEIIIKEYALNINRFDYGLVINEVMASNKTGIKDEYDEFDDWIEIYNSSDEAVWMGNFTLTNDTLLPSKWQMPDNYIQPGEFFILWADSQESQGVNHTNFTLDKDGGTIRLYALNDVLEDELIYNEQTSDISIGREYDASENWIYFNSPTPGASNSTTSIEENLFSNSFYIYPNPANGEYVNLSKKMDYIVYNTLSKKITTIKNYDKINITNYNKGVYIVVSEAGSRQKLIIN